MKLLKTFGKILLCMSISMYGLPAFANTASTATKIKLSDTTMDSVIGGSMHAEILSNPISGTAGPVKALVAVGNIGCCSLNYALEVVDVNGNLVRTLASGSIDGNQALVISGEGEAGDLIYRARVDFASANIAGLEAVDTVWPQFQ